MYVPRHIETNTPRLREMSCPTLLPRQDSPPRTVSQYKDSPHHTVCPYSTLIRLVVPDLDVRHSLRWSLDPVVLSSTSFDFLFGQKHMKNVYKIHTCIYIRMITFPETTFSSNLLYNVPVSSVALSKWQWLGILKEERICDKQNKQAIAGRKLKVTLFSRSVFIFSRIK